MPRRDNRGTRPAPRTRDRSLILVVCGGIRTERDYLDGLRTAAGTRAVDVRVLARPRSPTQIVQYAARRVGPDFDEVWCVFDVDDFDVEPAVRAARDRGIRLAVSNPCFELWLLLHHQECARHVTDYADAASLLRRHVPAYDKAELNFADYALGLPDALARARAIEPTGTDHTVNPSTSMWRLVEKIMECTDD